MGLRDIKIGPIVEVKVTIYLERYGNEVKIDSTQNDGTQSWTVIFRGMNKYVTELPEENEKPIQHEEVTTRRDKTKGTIYTVFVFIFDDYKTLKISKRIIRLLRHQGHHREKGWSYFMEKVVAYVLS